MALVGGNDLQARSAYQPIIHEQNGRWILYVGHHGGTRAIPRPVNPLTGQADPALTDRDVAVYGLKAGYGVRGASLGSQDGDAELTRSGKRNPL